MFKNYCAVAIRNLLKHKIYSTISITGLAIGMACCVLILLFVRRELRVDRFHTQGDQIYKVVQEIQRQGNISAMGWGTPGALGPALKTAFPEIQEGVRIMRWSVQVESNGKTFNETLCLVDPNILTVFSFPLDKGHPSTALAQPTSAVITEKTAKRYFGETDPMGKVITVQDRMFQGDFMVSGVLRDLPDESTIQFGILITDAYRDVVTRRYWENWLPGETIRPVETYLLLPKRVDPDILEQKLVDFAAPYLGATGDAQTIYHLQPLNRVYLYAKTDHGIGTYDGIGQVYMLSGIAIFILAIACINFMNLATAHASNRAKEVGMRKVVGASRWQIIGQFLGESTVMALMALIFAVGLAEVFLPVFNAFIGRDLVLNTDVYIALLPWLLGITFATGLLAGSYPAFVLSAYRPSATLKGRLLTNTRGVWLRKALVVFQFSISVFLVLGTLVIDRQIRFMVNQDPGFDAENLIVLPIFLQSRQKEENVTNRLSRQYELVKQEFLRYPNVISASAFRFIPILQGGGISRQIRPEGHTGDPWLIPVNEVDEDFFKTFGIDLIAGKQFTKTVHTGLPAECMINETAAKQFGWEDPIGKVITWLGRGTCTVIGVVKDFHMVGLNEPLGPAIFINGSFLFNNIGLKVKNENLSETLAQLETTWQKLVPGASFSTLFIDDRLQNWTYGSERRLRRIAGTASVLAILIACLGLFGLASFSAHQRIKEIGVRKVLGARVTDIVILLSKDLVKLVLVANLITWPFAYYAMSSWLQNFPYRIKLEVSLFALCTFLSLAVALAIVSWQALRTARLNPVDALRNE